MRELHTQSSHHALEVTSVILNSAQRVCLQRVLWPANMALSTGVFQECLEGCGGCQQFLGSSGPQQLMVWGAGKGFGRRQGTHTGLCWCLHLTWQCQAVMRSWQRSASTAAALAQCSQKPRDVKPITYGEADPTPWPWRQSRRAKAAKGFTVCAQMQGVLPFLQNQDLKIPSCQKFIGCNWFLPSKTQKNLHLSLDILNGVHLSLLRVCKPWAWWMSVPGLCCSTANIYIKI